jgi:hypothetical protein
LLPAFFDIIGWTDTLGFEKGKKKGQGDRVKGKHLFGAALAAGWVSGPAWAASVVFDFASPTLLPMAGASFTFRDAGSGISVQARGFEGNTPSYVTMAPTGLGVLSAPLWQPLLNAVQVDGVGGNESLRLSFSRSVTLDSLTFNLVDSDDNIKLSVLDPTTGTIYNNLIDPAPASTSGPLSTLTLDLSGLPNRSGLVFSLSAKDPSDNFAVAGLKANYLTAPKSGGVTGGNVAVPLPMAAWAGMGLFAFVIGLPAVRRRVQQG